MNNLVNPGNSEIEVMGKLIEQARSYAENSKAENLKLLNVKEIKIMDRPIVEYSLKNDKVLKDGHTMFPEDIVKELKRKAYLETLALSTITPEEALKALIGAFRDDPDYAYSWHCNIAMAFYDASGPVITDSNDHIEQLRIANEAASRFMKLAFGVITKQKG